MNDWFDAEAHVDRALELFERGRWAEAEAELRKALALNPDQPEWHFNLGLTLEASGRDSEALTAFSRATELLPDESQPALAAGMVAMRLSRFEEARQWFEHALKLDPASEPAHANLIDCLTRLDRPDEALTAFYLAQQSLEESALCYAAVSEALIRKQDYDRAEWCLKEALRISPAIPRVRARLARIFAATGRPHRALQMYLRELRDDPGNVEALLDYGDLLIEMGRLPEAAEKFRRVLELQPAHVDAHMRLGEIALAANRLEQAHLELELVLKLDPSDPDARSLLAETLLRRGRLEEAQQVLRAELDRLAQIDQGGEDDSPSSERGERPSRPPAGEMPALPLDGSSRGNGESNVAGDLGRLGRVLLEADFPKESATILARAIDEQGESVELLRRLAVACFRCGDSRRGCAVSRRIVRLDPACVEAMYNLALAALEERRLRFASGWIRRGLRCQPDDEGLRRLRLRLWAASVGSLVERLFTYRLHLRVGV